MANHLQVKKKKQTNKKTIKCWLGQKSDSSRRITLYRTYPIYDAPLFAPCKEIQESLGFWIPIPGTGFRTLSVEFGFQIPIVNGIPDSSSRIPDFKASDTGFLKKKFPRFRNPQVKISRIPESRFPYFPDCLYVSRGPIRYSFRAGTRATRYSVIISPYIREIQRVLDSGFHTVVPNPKYWIPDSSPLELEIMDSNH